MFFSSSPMVVNVKTDWVTENMKMYYFLQIGGCGLKFKPTTGFHYRHLMWKCPCFHIKAFRNAPLFQKYGLGNILLSLIQSPDPEGLQKQFLLYISLEIQVQNTLSIGGLMRRSMKSGVCSFVLLRAQSLCADERWPLAMLLPFNRVSGSDSMLW